MSTIIACDTHKRFDGAEAEPTPHHRLGCLSARLAVPVTLHGHEVTQLDCHLCRFAHEPRALLLELRRLPDMAAVGGNARHGHWGQRAGAFAAEREAWLGEIRALPWMLPPYPSLGRVVASVELVFREERQRDQDNLLASLKPLIDTLKSEERGGYFGLIDNDDDAHLTVAAITPLVDKERAPLTRVLLVRIEDGPVLDEAMLFAVAAETMVKVDASIMGITGAESAVKEERMPQEKTEVIGAKTVKGDMTVNTPGKPKRIRTRGSVLTRDFGPVKATLTIQGNMWDILELPQEQRDALASLKAMMKGAP